MRGTDLDRRRLTTCEVMLPAAHLECMSPIAQDRAKFRGKKSQMCDHTSDHVRSTTTSDTITTITMLRTTLIALLLSTAAAFQSPRLPTVARRAVRSQMSMNEGASRSFRRHRRTWPTF